MNYYFIVNLDKPNALRCAGDAADALAALDQKVLAETAVAPLLQNSTVQGLSHEQALASCDMVVAIGGDGTLIHAAMQARAFDKPIIGINSGRLGFLSQIEYPFSGELQALVQGEYTIQPRTVLQADIHTADGVLSACALNDVVIARRAVGSMIDIEVARRGRHCADYRADGLIFATATGSTAYSLSAGGAIVDPAIDCLLMTPICPHTLGDRCVILSPHDELTLRLLAKNSHPEATVAVDGTVVATLYEEDLLTISRSEHPVQFVQLHTNDFYRTMNRKFRGGR